MAWVITRLCRDCTHQSCVEVCPVECIYRYTGSQKQAFPDQLFIDPEECIDCGACEPQCPWEAIFPESEVPPGFADDIDLNARIGEQVDSREVPGDGEKADPTDAEVEANKMRWGVA